MGKVRVFNASRNSLILQEAKVADRFWGRLQGLLCRKNLPPGEGLIIKPCKSVHTFFMTFPIDVCFVDREGRICFLMENLRPYRFTPFVKNSFFVVEAPAGTLRDASCGVGDEIRLEVMQ